MFRNKIFKLLKTQRSNFKYVSIWMPFYLDDDDETPKSQINNVEFNNSILFNNYNEQNYTQEICDKLVSENPEMIAKIPKQFITSKMCDMVININPNNIKYIPVEFISDYWCKRLMNMNVDFYFVIPKEKRTQQMYDMIYQHYKTNIANDYGYFRYIPTELINDEFIKLTVIKSNGKVSYDRLTTTKVSPKTQIELNQFCERHKDGYGYCYKLLKTLSPQIPKHE